MSNLGLNFVPIQVSGDLITERLKLKNAQITVDDNDDSVINLSNLVGNTASFANINVIGDANVDKDLEVGGNIKIGLNVKLDPTTIVVPFATVQVINAQTADLKEITSNNITNGNTIITNRIHSNIGNIATINSTTINSSQINNSGTIFATGADINGHITVRNPSNATDYLQINPQADSVYIGGSNIVLDGQTNNYTMTIDGFSVVNINDPLRLNQSTITNENLSANSITLNNFTPATKTDKLYNINGELYFNNKKLQEASIVGNYVPIIQQVSNDISKYQTCVSYSFDFAPIPNNGTLLYYSQRPYPSFSDLPSLIYLYNSSNSTQSIQLYDVSSQRTVGKLDGFHLTIYNNNHRIAIYFSDKTNPTFNIWDGFNLVTHIHIETDEAITFVYQQTFNQFFIVSRSVNMENYNIKLNNFESIGLFTGTNANLSGYIYANLGAIATGIMPNLLVNNLYSQSSIPGNVNLRQADLIVDATHSIIYSNTTITQPNQLAPKSYVDAREAVFRNNLLSSQNTWTNTNQFNAGVSLVDTSIINRNTNTSKYIQQFPDTTYIQNSAGTNYTIDGQNNTGDLVIQNFNHLRSVQPLKTNSITPIGGTLTVGGDNGLSTLNLATSDSTQIVNVGTGIGATTINIGQPGDTININGNVNYTTVHDLAINDKDLVLNANAIGAGTARGAGLFIRDNNSNIAGKFVVNSLGTGYNLKAPEEAREVNFDLPNFNNGLLKVSSNVISSSAGAISDITGLQTALDSKYEKTGGTISGQVIVDNARLYASRDGGNVLAGPYGDFQGHGTLFITGKTNTNRNIAIGIDQINDLYIIQSIEAGIALKPLSLNPSGGSVDIGRDTVNNSLRTLSSGEALQLLNSGHSFIGFRDNSGRYAYIGRPGTSSTDFSINVERAGTRMYIYAPNGILIDNTLNMNNNKITNLGNPTSSGDATSKQYVDGLVSGNVSGLLSSNNTWTGTNQFNNNLTVGAVSAGRNQNTIGITKISSPGNLSHYMEIDPANFRMMVGNHPWTFKNINKTDPLYINTFTTVQFGGSGDSQPVSIYGQLTNYDSANTNKYIQYNPSTGINYSGIQNVVFDGQNQGTSFTIQNYNAGIELKNKLELTDSRVINMTRDSSNSSTEINFKALSGTVIGAVGVDSATSPTFSANAVYLTTRPSGGGSTQSLVLGTQNTIGINIDYNQRLTDKNSRHLGIWQANPNGTGQYIGRYVDYSGTWPSISSTTNNNTGFTNIALGTQYTPRSTSSGNWLCNASGCYAVVTDAGWYNFELDVDINQLFVQIGNVPYSKEVDFAGIINIPVYVAYGDLFFNIMALNQSGAGKLAFKLTKILNYSVG